MTVVIKGHSVEVDNKDIPLATEKGWGVAVLPGNKIYFHRRRNGRHEYLHRLILGITAEQQQADHISGDTLDNRRANLRIATSSQNHFNMIRASNNTSGYKGVSWHKQRRKWRAYIKLHRRQISLGLYSDKVQAAAAYRTAASQIAGEFARWW